MRYCAPHAATRRPLRATACRPGLVGLCLALPLALYDAMEPTSDGQGFWFGWAVHVTHCAGPTPLTAGLVDEWEDESDDDHHEHEEPQIHIHTGIVRLATDGRQPHRARPKPWP